MLQLSVVLMLVTCTGCSTQQPWSSLTTCARQCCVPACQGILMPKQSSDLPGGRCNSFVICIVHRTLVLYDCILLTCRQVPVAQQQNMLKNYSAPRSALHQTAARMTRRRRNNQPQQCKLMLLMASILVSCHEQCHAEVNSLANRAICLLF